MFKKVKRILPIMCACLLLFGSCLIVSASEMLNIDDFNHTVLPYKVAGTYNGNTYIYFSAEPVVKQLNDNTNGLGIFIGREVKFYCVQITADMLDGTWSEIQMKTGVNYFNLDSILASNYDVLDSSGEVFFQNPPDLSTWVRPIVPEVRKQVKIIVPIAVFCLALLIGLTVLVRKLPVFLKR